MASPPRFNSSKIIPEQRYTNVWSCHGEAPKGAAGNAQERSQMYAPVAAALPKLVGVCLTVADIYFCRFMARR